jgi:hypothetical protein
MSELVAGKDGLEAPAAGLGGAKEVPDDDE